MAKKELLESKVDSPVSSLDDFIYKYSHFKTEQHLVIQAVNNWSDIIKSIADIKKLLETLKAEDCKLVLDILITKSPKSFQTNSQSSKGLHGGWLFLDELGEAFQQLPKEKAYVLLTYYEKQINNENFLGNPFSRKFSNLSGRFSKEMGEILQWKLNQPLPPSKLTSILTQEITIPSRLPMMYAPRTTSLLTYIQTRVIREVWDLSPNGQHSGEKEEPSVKRAFDICKAIDKGSEALLEEALQEKHHFMQSKGVKLLNMAKKAIAEATPEITRNTPSQQG